MRVRVDKAHQPQRMCVVCRQKRPKLQLVRWVQTAKGWLQDARQAGQQRGTYSCHGNCEQKFGLRKVAAA